MSCSMLIGLQVEIEVSLTVVSPSPAERGPLDPPITDNSSHELARWEDDGGAIVKTLSDEIGA